MIKTGVVANGKTPCVCGKPIKQAKEGGPLTCGDSECISKVQEMGVKVATAQGRRVRPAGA